MRRRGEELVTQWASIGVYVAPLAHHRHWVLRDRLREGQRGPTRPAEDLGGLLRTFTRGRELVTIIGWGYEDQPALRVATEPLLTRLNAALPILDYGFTLINDATAKGLGVDIDDEEGNSAYIVNLAPPRSKFDIPKLL